MPGVGNQLDSVSVTTPETRDAARRYLERSGSADLLGILGLAPPTCPVCSGPLADGGCRPCQRAAAGVAPATPEGNCPTCGNRMPKLGVCRKRAECREATEKVVAAGYRAREAGVP